MLPLAGLVALLLPSSTAAQRAEPGFRVTR